jgi:hypothetical protein
MYKLYSIGDRTEPWGTLACISIRVGISPSTWTLNFPLERNELISLTVLAEKFNLIISIASQGARWCRRLFRYPRILQP